MRRNSRDKKKTPPPASRQNKKLKNEIQNLKIENKKLKQYKEKLEEKIDDLREENRKLLHRIEEESGEKDKVGIRLPSQSVIKGDIESEKKIEVENEVRIVGSLKSEKDIILGYGNQIQGDVVSKNGDVKAGNSTEIGGIIKGKTIHLAEGVQAGQIKGEEKIILDDNCEVSDIFALGDVNIGENVIIDGTIRHAGDFNISRGINVTDSIVSKSKEELDEEAEEMMSSSPPFLPMIIKEGFSKSEDELAEVKGEEVDENSVRDNIDEVRSLIWSARDENIEISEEKTDLKEGISLFKKGEIAEAEDRFVECKRSLEKKLNIEEETEIGSETDGGEIEEDTEEDKTDEAEKEKIIETFQEIQGVGPSLAEDLYKGGFHSIEELKEASRSELLEIDGIGESSSKTIKENLD